MEMSSEKVQDRGEPRHKEDIASDQSKHEVDSGHEIDADLEKRVLRKQDYHILPWLFGIWLCAFIDRSNIGNARIDGLTEDLHLVGTMFNTALGKKPPPVIAKANRC